MDPQNHISQFLHVAGIEVRETNVAKPHHFYAAPAPGKNFDAALALALAALVPNLLYSKAKFLKQTKVYRHVETI
jgi:hypothetical protein